MARESDSPTEVVIDMGTLTLESPAFDDGERIPAEYGYTERNVNPPLEIDGVPDEADSLALIVDDPDAREPAGKIWDHWVVWNVPPETETIPEDWDAADATEGTNDYGDHGYGGPNPPDREHTYRFTLFALDTTLELDADTDADALESAIEAAREDHPDLEVIAQRTRRTEDRSVEEFRTRVFESLTEKQRRSLETAYGAGFFDWPREQSGEEVAETLGIAPATFSQHLRTAQRKVMEALLADESEERG